MRFKKDEDGKLVVDENGDPIAIDSEGNPIPLDKVISEGKHTRLLSRVEQERDTYKEELEKLRAQVDELSKITNDKEELEKQLATIREESAKTKEELERALQERERTYALDTLLLGAGVPKERLRAAKALIDEVEVEDGQVKGFDLDAFKKENAYLFAQPQVGNTAMPQRSAGGKPTVEELGKMPIDEYKKLVDEGVI